MTTIDGVEFEDDPSFDAEFAKWEAETADTYSDLDEADQRAAKIKRALEKVANPTLRDRLKAELKRLDDFRIEANKKLQDSVEH